MILSHTIHASARAAGWRKVLALGAAGLAGLAPMKAQAGGWEPPGQTQVAPTQDQIQALQKQIDAKFGQIDDRTKANKNFQASMKNFRDAWDTAQDPSAKLTALQNIWTYLNYWASHSDELYQAQVASELNQAQAEPTRPFTNTGYSFKPGAVVTRRYEDLLKLKQLSAQGNKAAVHKFYRELISTQAAWEVKEAGDLNINVSVEPVGNGIVKMQSEDNPDAYIAQDDLIPNPQAVRDAE
jgi:hypothetical protein